MRIWGRIRKKKPTGEDLLTQLIDQFDEEARSYQGEKRPTFIVIPFGGSPLTEKQMLQQVVEVAIEKIDKEANPDNKGPLGYKELCRRAYSQFDIEEIKDIMMRWADGKISSEKAKQELRELLDE